MIDMEFKWLLEDSGVDSCLLTTNGSRVNENFYYLTGANRSSEVTAAVVITRKNPFIITNKLERRIFAGRKNIVVDDMKDYEALIKKYCVGKVGLDFSYVTANGILKMRKLLHGRNFSDISGHISDARSVKTQKEIHFIKEACKISEEALDKVGLMIKKCRTEKNLATELEYYAKKNGAEGLAYPTIVASCSNSSEAHHMPGNTKISRGVLLIDFGVTYNGYCSDITRTFCVGKANKQLSHVYETVYAAQKASIKKMTPKRSAKDSHKAADKIIRTLGQGLIHSVGHGLGICVHDFPAGINDKSNFKLKENMVVTSEPGFYTSWGGVRIEDDVIVKNSPVLLSRAPSTIQEI